MSETVFDCVVVGGGPAGATAAEDLARMGRSVLLLDRAGRIKPCGGAIPPRLIRDFSIPDDLLVARAASARMIAPSQRTVNMPIEGGFVGMVDRDQFDEFLRVRAAQAGAVRAAGTFVEIARDDRGETLVGYHEKNGAGEAVRYVRTRAVIGADGARSQVAKQTIPGAERLKCVFAYHEIIRTPQNDPNFDGRRCDVFYQGSLSPDFYSWIFPHGDTASVGVGSAQKGFSLRGAIRSLRAAEGLSDCETVRTEGAPIPLRPLPRWDDGRNVLLAGDACGVVAPASGEGIYYAMACGRMAADGVDRFLHSGDARMLAQVRKRFLKQHGRTFWILGVMQHFWYRNDKRRERFVAMCDDPDVQHLTWQAYMNKELVRAKPGAHMRIFMKDMGHLMGVSAP
ncbi:MAG: geranylgeranyl diphosphate reductase [Alphaproteobacteria bacterium]|nr:geranylgeranyl diphosphate reductase [Alphaproteobacteria bacterium]